MNENITILLKLLDEKQLNQEIIIIKNIQENKKIINFLNKIGNFKVNYSKDKSQITYGISQELEGSVFLWQKQLDDSWRIYLWRIKRLKKHL